MVANATSVFYNMRSARKTAILGKMHLYLTGKTTLTLLAFNTTALRVKKKKTTTIKTKFRTYSSCPALFLVNLIPQ